MIVGERKSLSEIKDMVRPYGKVLIAGCDTCTAECMAGGRKQVAELAAALDMSFRLEGQEKEIQETSVDRQCIHEFLLDVIDQAENVEAIISVACGAGVQSLAERLPGKPIFPGINTTFIGETASMGVWQERCRGCGDCILVSTAGLCPVTRCAKTLLNGPCGGSENGKCEVDPERDCAWVLIYNRMSALGELDRLRRFVAAKDYSKAAKPRKLYIKEGKVA